MTKQRAHPAQPWVLIDRDYLRRRLRVTFYLPDVWVERWDRRRLSFVIALLPWLFRIATLILFRSPARATLIEEVPERGSGAGEKYPGQCHSPARIIEFIEAAERSRTAFIREHPGEIEP